ncbi:MAG: SDR family oxidoreductase [Lachnospiraceae bacterium]|nr:SDR family oxidoreductase [Lachnospiraceae bacterium]
MISVKNRWALVTGAARGIGYGVALFLAKQGCNLILQARSEDHLKDVREKAEALGVSVLTVSAELSDLDSVQAMLAKIDSFGVPVDIIMNNAGLQIAYRTDWFTTPASDYEISFLVNTIAPMMIVYHLLPKMLERGFGRIVNTTSGIRLEPEQAGYSASKAALDKVTTDLASKYTDVDICINLTDPGWCRTDLGGPNAPNSPESSLPGVVIGAFVGRGVTGQCFAAPNFHGISLEEAVAKVESN